MPQWIHAILCLFRLSIYITMGTHRNKYHVAKVTNQMQPFEHHQ